MNLPAMLTSKEYWSKQCDNHLVIGQPGQALKLAQELLKFYNCQALDNYAELADKNQNPDLIVIPDKLTISSVRELENTISLFPWRKRRIVLIQNFATNEAWNAFLKLLEETPQFTTILIRTLEPGAVPVTIRSRVKVFHLGLEPEKSEPFPKTEHLWQMFFRNLDLSKKDRPELESTLMEHARYEIGIGNFKEAYIFSEAAKKVSQNYSSLITLDKMVAELLIESKSK